MPTNLRVLFVEDNPDDVELLERVLRDGGFELSSLRVETLHDLRAALAGQRWDLILSDHNLPSFSAPAALDLVKRSGLDIPFIVVTGTMDEEVAVATMRAGVSDYLAKSRLARLLPAVERELREAKSRRLLRETEQTTRHLAAIVQASSDAIISTTLEGLVTSWNPAAERLFGWTAAEASGRQISLIMPSDRAEESAEKADRLLRGEQVESFETVRLDKSGKRIDVSQTLSPIYDADGRLIGISRIARDISERKRAEAALLASEERFRSVVESDMIAIAFWTKEGEITDANDALLRIGGHTREDLSAGRVRWTDLTPDEYRPHDDWALEQIERTGKCSAYEKEVARADGTRVPILLGAAWLSEQDIGVAYVLDVTDRWRAEEALRRQTRILQSTLDSIGDGVAVADEHGQFVLFNPAAEQILRLGITSTRPEEWAETYSLYQPDGETLFPTADLPLVRAAIRGERVDRVEMYVKHQRIPEGLWISVTALPMHDEAGGLRGGVAVFRDVTEQKRIETRLAQDAMLLANVRDAVIFTDLDGTVTYWNDGARRLFGPTAQEMLGRLYIERYQEPERSRVLDLMQNIFDQGDWTGEWHDYRNDGTRVWINLSVTRIMNAAGEAIGLMGISHDITPRKQAEEALDIRDRAIQAATQGIVITDPGQLANPIVYASPGFERLTGYAQADVFGKNCRFLQGPDTEPAAVKKLREAVRDAQPVTVEMLNYRKDGSTFWNELSISPVIDTGGRLTHFVGVQTDVTARRALEEQFRQSQKMEAVGQLAGGVAHDFNNMLAVILGYSDNLLDSKNLKAEQKDFVHEINLAAQRAATLTRKLLAFSRKEVLAPKVLSLNSVIAEMERMLRRLIGEDVDLKTSLYAALWPVKVDPGQMEQVIMNLAINARDAMPRGGTLNIETGNVEFRQGDVEKPAELVPGRYVSISVRDSGHGMDASVLSRIFEPFFTTKEAGKGTGLGLAFIYGIIKQSGGHVTVASAPGRGTTFTILLPSADSRRHPSADSPPAQTVARGTETVLLVEDEDSVRKLLGLNLRAKGYQVLEANSGAEAIAVFQQARDAIRIVITDVIMPQMSGRVLLEQLRVVRPEVKALYISGYMDDAIVRQGIMESDVHFLHKPFLPSELAAKVREVLDGA